MSAISVSKSLSVIYGCLALPSIHQECLSKKSAAAVSFVGISPAFRSLIFSAPASSLSSSSASICPWSSKRRTSGVNKVGVMASASEWDQQVEEGQDGGGETYAEPPEGAKLFVGNLPFNIDSNRLAEVFNEAGIVEYVDVIIDRETGNSRGFGFVTMSTIEEADKAIEIFNQYDLDGRLLTVNKAAPRGTRVERPPRFGGGGHRLYVGNLPWQADDNSLLQLF